jgi:hypothetical protein
VPFIVHVKAVGNGVVFKVGNESSDVNSGHYYSG